MFYANDNAGDRIHIDDAQKGKNYLCPACGDQMIIKRGTKVAHHFAHKSRKTCDPWYSGEKSEWHIKMQSYFPADFQEVIIWDKKHREYHIADVAFVYGEKKCVFEFQHSPISQREFIRRTAFYMNCGFVLFWIFDFRDTEHPKKILYTEKYDNKTAQFIWPSYDRIRILDNLDIDQYLYEEYEDCNNLELIFHINTGLGEEYSHHGYERSWTTWDYKYPLNKELLFVVPIIDDYYYNTTFDRFEAHYYVEEDFYSLLKRIAKNATPLQQPSNT